MKINDIKPLTWAAALGLFAMVGLGACDKGTEPGDTNTERSEIIDEGELVEENEDPMAPYTDTTDLEDHYDHADHEDHDDNKAKAIGDGAYDGKKDGVQRDDLNN
ncbi:hypothetical protein [Pontibacter cellulosilyticus]|nr:hypothetical protein [Pontibacter cellulosilyticus]